MSDAPRCVLDSWKAIADYVKRDVRTARRWERERGLPVHRVPGHRGSVFGYADEIDAWLAGPQRARLESQDDGGRRVWPRRLAWTAVLVGAVLLGVAMAKRVWGGTGEVTALGFRADELRALGRDGAAVWTYHFERPLLHAPLETWKAMADVDGDGTNEVIVVAPLAPESGQAYGHEVLHAFSAEGRLLWRVDLSDDVEFGSRFSAPWHSSDLLVYGPPGRRAIAWTVHHHTWWPSMALRLTSQGEITHRFVNPGWLGRLNSTTDGRLLFASGVSNARDAAVVAVLNGGEFGGSAPEPAGSPYACVSCPAGGPLRYLVFPKSEVNEAGGFALAAPHVHVYPNGAMEIRVSQTAEELNAGEAIYEFDADLRPIRATFSDSYWTWHRRLEASGRISHARNACPKTQPPPTAMPR